jgi:hypothetical protein
MDQQDGAEFPPWRQETGGDRIILTQAAEITGDLPVEVAESIGPGDAHNQTRGQQEGPTLFPGKAQLGRKFLHPEDDVREQPA